MKNLMTADVGDRRFVIQQDDAVGFYIVVYSANRCTHDYLQDSLELALSFAQEELDVPQDAWVISQ